MHHLQQFAARFRNLVTGPLIPAALAVPEAQATQRDPIHRDPIHREIPHRDTFVR
jgi:hypothetical protein